MKSASTILLLITLFFSSGNAAVLRTLSNPTGAKIEAVITGIWHGKVTFLRVSDQKSFTVPINSLSSVDQEFLNQRSHLLTLPPSDSGLANGVALIAEVKGNVMIIPDTSYGYAALKAKVGDKLLAKARINTDQDSSAILLFTNGTVATVLQDSSVEIRVFLQSKFESNSGLVNEMKMEPSESNLLLDLMEGSLVVDVKKLNKSSSFNIHSPLAVAGIRGTQFHFNYRDNASYLEVIEGKVDFAGGSLPLRSITSGRRQEALKVGGENDPSLTPIKDIPEAQSNLMKNYLKTARESNFISKVRLEDLGENLITATSPQLPAMKHRTDLLKRKKAISKFGGTMKSEDSIRQGLRWLQSVQDLDGGWGNKDRDDQGNQKQTDRNAMTGMALLAYFAHFELPGSQTFGTTVQRGIDFLISTAPDGPVTGGNGAYSHPIRTHALCEAYAITKNPKLREYAKRAATAIIKGQNENGGWAYGYGKGPKAHTDLSVTSWNIQALKVASLTDLKLSGLDQAMDKAVSYVKRCQNRTGMFAYKLGSGGKPSLTGAGVYSLQMWKNAKSREAQLGLEWIIANQKKNWKEINLYEWYYHTQACFQANGVSGTSKYWRSWNREFSRILCEAQSPEGHWPPGRHFHGDTEIFRTTLAILMLEVYYRYVFP